MVKTIISICISFALRLGISLYEVSCVKKSFELYHATLKTLYEKCVEETATYEDGEAVRLLWFDTREELQFWLTHTAIETMDYQINETLGYLFYQNYKDALPKLEILLDLTYTVSHSHMLYPENIF